LGVTQGAVQPGHSDGRHAQHASVQRQVPVGDDATDVAGRVDYDHSLDRALEHHSRDVPQCCVFSNREDRAHHILNPDRLR
jgi:hypothetical protein